MSTAAKFDSIARQARREPRGVDGAAALVDDRQAAAVRRTAQGHGHEVRVAAVDDDVRVGPERVDVLHGLQLALADDVARLRTPGLLADGTTVEGYTYDVTTGRLIPLEDS